MLDGDNPGKKAIVNVGQILEEENLRVNVVALPEELDPDEYILKVYPIRMMTGDKSSLDFAVGINYMNGFRLGVGLSIPYGSIY